MSKKTGSTLLARIYRERAAKLSNTQEGASHDV